MLLLFYEVVTINDIHRLSGSGIPTSIDLTIGSSGFNNELVKEAEVGHSIVYQTNQVYDVRVAKIFYERNDLSSSNLAYSDYYAEIVVTRVVEKNP